MKASIKKRYIELLQSNFAFYTEGSRPLKMANEAADNALAGKLKLTGDCWFQALTEHNLKKTITQKALAALPE